MFWLILSVLLWGFLHSLLASYKAKEFALRWFGVYRARFYRLAYNLFAGISFLPILVVAAITPDRRLYTVPLPWSGLMGFSEFLAVVALVVGFQQTEPGEFIGLRQLKDGAKNDLPAGSKEIRQRQLVISGLYRHVRHPLYTAGLAFIWLLPFMTVNVFVINICLTIYVVIGAFFEERKLRREFGQEYVDYAAITPMLIPFIKRKKTPL